MNINNITLSGRLGAKPELKYTQNKLAILNFSIAQSDRQQDGTFKPMWFDVVVFDKVAEMLAPQLNKGDEIIVMGKLKIRSYTSKDGAERKIVEITAQTVKTVSREEKPKESFNDFSSSTIMNESDIPF